MADQDPLANPARPSPLDVLLYSRLLCWGPNFSVLPAPLGLFARPRGGRVEDGELGPEDDPDVVRAAEEEDDDDLIELLSEGDEVDTDEFARVIRPDFVAKAFKALSADAQRGGGSLARADVNRTYLRRKLSIAECVEIETLLATAGHTIVEDEEELSGAIQAGIQNAFELQDEPMIKAVRSRMQSNDLLAHRPAALPMDEASIRARRVLQRLIAEETSGGLRQSNVGKLIPTRAEADSREGFPRG